ncbi:MAG: hypothetical protein WAQ25_01815 [Candidatus Saccharimonas sp.]
MDTKNKIIVVVGAVALLSAAGIGGYVLFTTPDEPIDTPKTAQASQSTTSNTATASSKAGAAVAAVVPANTPEQPASSASPSNPGSSSTSTGTTKPASPSTPSTPAPSTPAPSTPTPPTPAPPAPTPTYPYRNGTYTATKQYTVPKNGANSITATITLSAGKITSVSVKNSYTDRESAQYVDSFTSKISGNASGQSIASYAPGRIGGASLTTNAFNAVLDSVRAQSKT